MMSYQLSVARFRSEIPFFKTGNISNHIKNWENIANEKLILNMIKNGVSMEFQETSHCQFVPHLKTGIIVNEMTKLLENNKGNNTNYQRNS